nr:PEPxxWA-CTERM sorting domain-containing protein [Polymorphobacter sp.]
MSVAYLASNAETAARPRRPRQIWLLAAAIGIAAPAQAAVQVIAVPSGPTNIVFDGLNGYGGSLVVSASLPVSLFYAANKPGAFALSGNNITGLLDIGFTVSASAPRNFYPFVDPFVKQSGAREGASWAGTLDTLTIRLTIPNGGTPITLLSLTTTAPGARFFLDDFLTYQTNGRGLKLEQIFGGSERHNGRIQAGNCHISFCTLGSPESFTLQSDLLRLGETIQPGSFKGLVVNLRDADAGFTSGPNGPFSVPFGILAFASAVPEPATWTMMVLGFGLIGHGLRRRNMKYSGV